MFLSENRDQCPFGASTHVLQNNRVQLIFMGLRHHTQQLLCLVHLGLHRDVLINREARIDVPFCWCLIEIADTEASQSSSLIRIGFRVPLLMLHPQ